MGNYMMNNIREKYKKYLVELSWVETVSEINLLSICIEKDYRNKGKGRKIMREIFDYCKRTQKDIHLISANGTYYQRKMLKNFYQDVLGMEQYIDEATEFLCYRKRFNDDNKVTEGNNQILTTI